MVSKGLSKAEIEKIIDFDWDDSADDEDWQEELERPENFESVIEETLQKKASNGENIEDGLIEGGLPKQTEGSQIENEEVEQGEVGVNIDLLRLRWRNTEAVFGNTIWGSAVRSNEVKQPIDYFNQFFSHEVWQMICDQTNLYAAQNNEMELQCTVHKLQRHVGIYSTLL